MGWGPLVPDEAVLERLEQHPGHHPDTFDEGQDLEEDADRTYEGPAPE